MGSDAGIYQPNNSNDAEESSSIGNSRSYDYSRNTRGYFEDRSSVKPKGKISINIDAESSTDDAHSVPDTPGTAMQIKSA